MFYFEKIKNKKILKSDMLNGLQHCFTTRDTMLKSLEPEDIKIVENNKLILSEYFGISTDNFINPVQTHSTNIAVVQKNKNEYPDTDALILTDKNILIYLNFADCTPVILYDKSGNIAAICHAGWRGTAGKIVPKTIEQMNELFNCKPQDITAAIGPAIGQCCYCVNEDVAQKLDSTIKDTNECIKQSGGKYYVDLKKINHRQILATGVTKIDICDYCTSCANELFFSYRKENCTTKRHSAVIKLQ